MAQVTLKADTGRALGSRPSRRLRQTGRVPGVVYGMGEEPRHVDVNHHDLSVAFHSPAGVNVLINLEIDDEMGIPTLVREIERHPYRNLIRHVDFIRVSLTEEVTADVALHFVGTPVGAKDGGVLTPIRNTVEVEALPTEIPAFIEVDVSHLGIHDDVRVADLPVLDRVTVLDDPDELLVTVSPPTVEVVAEPAEEEGAIEGGEEAAEAAEEDDD
ncbi:MAG: 50S ribosomal protein L25 [Actinomycetota bacterium]